MNYTVIVAEDEELLLNNLVHKIEKADPDFQVIGTAQTGAQALSLVEQMSPDVVFTDIKMPVMDGITLLTRIRDQFPFTKLVITSGFSDFEYAKKAITLIRTNSGMYSLRSNRNFRSSVMTMKLYSLQVLLACHRDRLQNFSRTSWYRIMQRIST